MKQKKKISELWILAFMLLALIIPSLITLNTIQEPRPLVPLTTPSASPYGYTWSLSLFIVPCIILLTWLHFSKEHRIQLGAFWLTVALMATLGLMLDIFLGLTFFTFNNTGATLGIHFFNSDITCLQTHQHHYPFPVCFRIQCPKTG